MKFYQIDFKPVGKSGKCKGNQSLLDCAHQSGPGIVSICGVMDAVDAVKCKFWKELFQNPQRAN